VKAPRHTRRGALALGACLLAAALAPAAAQAQPSSKPFEVENFHLTPSTVQAGAHEDLTTSFDFAHTGSGASLKTNNDVRDVIVELPAGFDGNNTAVPTCTDAQLLSELCPIASQVGQISFEAANPSQGSHPPGHFTVPIYNMEVTSFGVAAEFGFKSIIFTQVLTIRVRPGDSGLTVITPDITQAEPRNVSVTIWGLPASHVHDEQRGQDCGAGFEVPPICKHDTGPGGPQEAGIPVRPYLSNPTSCGPFEAKIKADSWEHPEQWSEESATVGPIKECDRVPFEPSIKAQPTTDSAESPSGLNVALDVPQVGWKEPVTIASANLKDATVTLPQGYSLNPSAGSGLGVCTPQQYEEEAYNSPPGAGCPPESRVGTVEVTTPVLTEHALGSVYVAKPFANPFNSLLALYIVAKIPERGVIVKVAGKVSPDPVSGQLTTTFKENPQQPFSEFTLRFRQGATSPLISPPACGAYTALADLTPWSDPLSPQHLLSSFEIEHGIGGGPCPSGGVPPFHPALNAGTINNRAGSYSPFYVRLSRNDGEQEITHFSIKLPPGITGKLAGIPYCPDSAIAQAKSRSHPGEAAIEEANPSCPAASEVGHTLVEAGVGSVLAQAPGKVYLAGPYHGAPISVVSITDAHVGPFDLGTVVVQLGFKINPETAEVFVDSVGSDPIPHIIDGIPTHLRTIRVYMDKPNFVLNPTGCEPTSTASTVLGSGKDFVSEADDVPVTASSPFQAADCAALGFKPQLKLSLIGATHRGGAPKLKAVLTANPGDANIGSAQVTLPHSEFLFNAHIKTICTRVVFAEGAIPGEKCPAGSVYGFAKAITPILSEPLEGPVYLRSSSHQLPDLVAALHNNQVNIALDGHVEGVNNGQIRNTFEAVPDAPVTSFTLEMQGGGKGLLENSTDLCASPHHATADFVGHNGKVEDFRPLLNVSCGKKGKHQKGKRHGKRRR
jgi:hypothetical protein